MNKRRQGKKFEDLVSNYLIKKGYSILDRNFTIRGGEIDIISSIDDIIVFVEVKSLQKSVHLNLAETIGNRKKRHLIRSCEIWLSTNRLEGVNWRIDFVGIKFDSYDKIIALKHIEGAVFNL